MLNSNDAQTDHTDTRDKAGLLADSDPRLRLLLDGIKDFAIFMMDTDGRVSSWNAGAERLKGYRAEEIIGKHFSCFYPSRDIDIGTPRRELELAKTKGRHEQEGWRVRKGGAEFWANASITALCGPHGELLGFGAVVRDITERHVATQKLDALHERFERAVDATRDGLFEGSAFGSGDSLWVSPRWWKLLGYDRRDTPQTITAAAISEMIHPDDRAAVAQARSDSASSGTPCAVEHRMRTRQGTWLWVHTSSAAELDATGQVIRISGSMQDISARKQIESELKQTNERFAIASNAGGLGFWEFDIRSNTLQWDDQMFRLYGRSRLEGEQPYALWASSLHPHDRARSEQEVAEAINGARAFDTEFRIVHPNGDIRHLKAAASVTRGIDGRAVQMVGVSFDITERKQLTADLQLARADLQAILDNVPARITYWNADWTNRFANRAAEAQFGLKPGQATGRHVRKIIGDVRYKRAKQYLDAALSGERQSYEQVDRQPNGSLRYSQVTYVPTLKDGAVVGFCALGSDVTDLRNSYHRIRELAQRLETIREDERRSVAVMLHEGIAQDLAAALLRLGRLESQPNDAQYVTQLCTNLRQALKKCIEELRQGAEELRPATFAHLKVSDMLLSHARSFANLSGLNIEVTEIEPFPTLAEAKQLLFFRAAQEALINVASHAQAKSVEIILRADAESIAMDIADDGIGIPDGAMDKPGSFGLLGIRERFAALGGGLTVERNAPTGTRVSVRLPNATA